MHLALAGPRNITISVDESVHDLGYYYPWKKFRCSRKRRISRLYEIEKMISESTVFRKRPEK